MKRLIYSAILVLTILGNAANAQTTTPEEKKSTINIGADLMSRYVWRGLDYGASPSVQPYIEYAHKSGFTLGYWGAMSTLGTYSEVDLYAKYAVKSVTFIATDYFFPKDGIPATKSFEYLNYKKATTGHLIEGSVQYKGGDNCPLSLLLGTVLYGADQKSNGDLRYSTYAELGYTFKCNGSNFDTFMGLTPSNGLYGTSFGVVNMGITGYKTIKLTDKFELPVKASIIANPQTSNIYLVFGITL